jgi:hypothetical protein
MALNDDWMADVRRWYFDERGGSAATPARQLASDLFDATHPIGYEAALPALQLSPADLGVASDPARGSSP